MTREEILAKSREENKTMDEREQKITLFAKGISGAIGLMLCTLINMINIYNNGPKAVGYAMWAVVCGIYATEHFANAIQLKKGFSWFFAALFAITGMIYLKFYLGTIL